MSYNDVDRAKWEKVLVSELISSDESEIEDEKSILIVKELSWRSVRVSTFFSRLDQAHEHRKSEQACRQTKSRVVKGKISSRPTPTNIPSWACRLVG